jgi:hypothetical protein
MVGVKYVIQSNKTSVSLFSLSNNETYLSISLHSRRKNIVFYSRIMAIPRSDELRHSPAARDKIILRSNSIIIRSLIYVLSHALQ